MESEEKPLHADGESASVPAKSGQQLLGIFEPSPASIVMASEYAPERPAFAEIFMTWLTRSASAETRRAYARDVLHFLRFVGIPSDRPERLASARSIDVIAWRDHLQSRGLANSSVSRKITVLRSLFAFLQVHGYASTNPAHRHFVATPPVPRDGKKRIADEEVGE